MRPVNLVLFGDQAVEKLSSIRALVRHSKTSAGAKRLLQEATDLVQIHLNTLSDEDRAWRFDADSLLQLAEDNAAAAVPNAVIATVLMCIGRLGELIVHAEQDASILGSDKDQVQVLAFCTGLLPAAVLVAAKDSNDAFELGREIISITFRMSMAIQRRLTMIEDSNLSWASTLIGIKPKRVQSILDEFHELKSIPYAKRIAVSVVSTQWLTITGAPSTLKRLMQFSSELNDCPKIETDTKAAHTPYLPPIDMGTVLGESAILDMPICSKARILSPSTCQPYAAKTLRSLLSDMILDIVANELLIDDTTKACVSAFGDRPVSLVVAGPTAHQPAVEGVLKLQRIKYEIKQHKLDTSSTFSRGGSGSIAVVGMSARLPGSNDLDTFFETLMDGKTQLQKIPESRFDINKYHDATGEQRNSTSADQGAFLERPGYFDHRLFSISPREALQMDPLQRLLLTTSWEALEMAGYSRDATPSTKSNRIATYFGQAANDWRDVLNNDEIDIYYVPALSRPFGPGRLAYHHKWGGGTYSIDSACATSTTAIHLACQALSSRECDTAVAGGGSLCVSPMTFAGLSKSGMISDQGGCRTFHDDADGYARGEGIGVVILKRLEDAVADNDNILGIIRGHARTYTTTSTSITHPSAESQARVYNEVLRQTAMQPNEIAYVEMHGTGTQAGDFEEITSVIQVLGKERSRNNVLTVGAVKANVGHGEGAAGVTSLIKVLLMLQERKIPPQPGLPFKINRRFPDLDPLHVRIAGMGGRDNTILKPSPASRNGKIKCLVSTFDATGGNTSLIVEEAPSRPKKAENPLPTHIVALSAKTPASLLQNQKRLLDYLVRHPETRLPDLAYSTTSRRMHEVLRTAFTGQSTKDIVTKLRQSISQSGQAVPKKSKSMNVMFSFTGQGSQYAGMGRQLFLYSTYFRDMLQSYEQMCEHQGLPRFLHLISEEYSDVDSLSTVVIQLAMVALEVATARLLKSWGVQPNAVIGHSLGEYAALCVAGVLSVSDTLYLVGRRAQLMEQRLVSGQFAMLAVPKSLKATMHLLAAEINALRQTQVACINAPESTVVSGPVSEIKHLQNVLEAQGSRAAILRTPYGFHSHHIDTILGDFEGIARAIQFSAPTIPVASSLLGKVVEAGDSSVFSSEYLVRQARDCVDFTGAVQAYQKHSLARLQTFWIDLGPEPMSVSLARRTLFQSSDHFGSVIRSSENNWTSISNLLASLYQLGIAINWPRYHAPFSDTLKLLGLPSYAFDEKNYWKTYVERSSAGHLLDNDASGDKKPQTRSVPAFSTTSLQRIEKEVVDGNSISIVFASHTSEPKLYEAIQGHIVNGSAIMSMSIFCDMAKSAAQYAYQRIYPNHQVPQMSIHDVDMKHAIIVPHVDPEQVVFTKISFPGGDTAFVDLSSTTRGNESIEHGSVRVVFGDPSLWFSQHGQTSFLVDARIQSLKEMSSRGAAHRLMKTVAYKLFDNLVTYSACYKAMEEVWIDRDCRDAVATIRLPSTSGVGTFLHNPFWSDGSIHLGGFLLNSGLKYADDIGCLCTGLGSWHTLEELNADDTYTTYTAVQETDNSSMLIGSAYVYNSQQKLVQIVTGLRFHKMKKVALDTILARKPAQIQSSSVRAATPPVAKREDAPANLDFGTAITTVPSYGDSDRHSIGRDSGYATPDQTIQPGVFDAFLSIVSSECGCSAAELDSGTLWSDVGLDSLMAITIIATFKKQVGVELPVTFFLDHQTVNDARDALVGPSPAVDTTIKIDSAEATDVLDRDTINEEHRDVQASPIDVEDCDVWVDAEQEMNAARNSTIADEAATKSVGPVSSAEECGPAYIKPSQAVLLHGSPSISCPALFLLPDGSGSPSSYIGLPALDPSINIYALQSPFVKCPSEFTCSFGTICRSFLDAIKDIQPSGPYLLGGFSFGALYAYEVSRLLLEQGETVNHLFLGDMAVPGTIDSPGVFTQQLLTEAGLLPSTGPMTAIAKEHYSSTVRAVASHSFIACQAAQPANTLLLCSKDGIASGRQSELAQWARGNDSPSRGWQTLLNGSPKRKELEATHFRLLKYPFVKLVGDALNEALNAQ